MPRTGNRSHPAASASPRHAQPDAGEIDQIEDAGDVVIADAKRRRIFAPQSSAEGFDQPVQAALVDAGSRSSGSTTTPTATPCAPLFGKAEIQERAEIVKQSVAHHTLARGGIRQSWPRALEDVHNH